MDEPAVPNKRRKWSIDPFWGWMVAAILVAAYVQISGDDATERLEIYAGILLSGILATAWTFGRVFEEKLDRIIRLLAAISDSLDRELR